MEWRKDDSVWYDVSVFSTAGHPVAKVAHPFVRYLQHRFAKDTMRTFQEYCESSDNGSEHQAL